MLKWRFSLAMSIVAGILTFLFGIFQHVRIEILLYRTVVSMFVFSIIGFVFGILLGRFFYQLLTKCQTKGTQVDVTAGDVSNSDHPYSAPEFTPLSPDNIEQVFRPKN